MIRLRDAGQLAEALARVPELQSLKEQIVECLASIHGEFLTPRLQPAAVPQLARS
jgi:hypothetical protein